MYCQSGVPILRWQPVQVDPGVKAGIAMPRRIQRREASPSRIRERGDRTEQRIGLQESLLVPMDQRAPRDRLMDAHDRISRQVPPGRS
jgi:hypothetical protein